MSTIQELYHSELNNREPYNKYWYKKGDALLTEIVASQPGPDEVYLWYLGQCGFILKQKKTILIDGVLNDMTDHEGHTRRLYPVPFDPVMLKVDYVLCTHAHADHMALETLALLAASNARAIFIAPEACLPMMTASGIPASRIYTPKAGQKLNANGLSVIPVSAAHPTHELTPKGGNVAFSYHLTLGSVRILHCGDTYLTDQYLEAVQKLPAPDILLPPINGGDYFRTARNCIGNLNAREAATLAHLLGADLTIPTHYDMIVGNTVDPLDFVREYRALNSAAKWALPALGERIVYKK